MPGLVDAASHLTMPGGAPWIERALDPPDQLVAVAERNGELLTQAGVRWARDVGSPHAVDACMADQLGLTTRRIAPAGVLATRGTTRPRNERFASPTGFFATGVTHVAHAGHGC